MIKCSIDDQSLRQIKNMTARVLRTYLKEHEPVSTLKTNMRNLFNTISEQYELSDVSAIADMINSTSSRYGVVEQIPDFFSVENIINLITAASNNIQVNDQLETSSDQITNIQQVRTRLEASREFLDNAYGLAKEVLSYVQNQTNQNIFDCCFINRGSVGQKIGIVKNNQELNNNIRNYQSQLLKRITTYLKSIVRNSPNLNLDPSVRRAIGHPVLYDQNNNYTGIMELLEPILNMYLSKMDTDQLRQVFNTMNDSTVNQEERQKAKQRLDAYNARVILDNFDTYLTLTLGKAIQIKDFNQKTGEDKYQISEKTAKLATTWRVSENIDVEAEADAITKLAINTTPLMRWQSDIQVDGQFIHFSDFQHIIAKIKDLAYNEEAYNIVFDQDFINDNYDLWQSLQEDTRKLLQGRSLNSAISILRRNPRKYLHSLFDILTNSEFKDLYGDLYYDFTNDELNKLYSISRGIFNGSNSLYNLVGTDADTDYYAYITQTADSIFNVKYIQYYRDQDGIVQVRTLVDQGINNIKRSLEQTINTTNSSKLIKDWQAYKNALSIRPIEDQNTLQSISFIIPNTDIHVNVLASSGDVIIQRNGIAINYAQSYDEILPFIDKILGLNLSNNTQLQEALIEQFSDITNMSRNLLHFASRVILNQYVSNDILEGSSLQTKEQLLQTIYGRNAPRYNYSLDELGLVHGNDVRTLDNIAIAKANMQGLTTSTQVKDGAGNGQSQQTLSRLLGSLQSQFELQERNADSVTKHFILLNTPGLLEEVYTAKEFNDQSNGSKGSTDMNVSEMAYSQLVYDFVGGLLDRDGSYTVGNGRVLFLPSVNSDKSTIGRLKVNLNKEVVLTNVQGEEYSKPLKDLTSQELEQLISKEFGTMYSNMYNKIVNDWYTLDQFIKQFIPTAPSIGSDFTNGFKQFNTWFFLNRDKLKQYGANPAEFVKYFTLEYNKQHRLSPLTIIDQVHYKNSKGNLGINQAIIAQIARFDPENQIFQKDPELLRKYPTSKQFWTSKKAEVLKALLKNEFKINTSNINQPELKYIRDNYKGWINQSGDLILAKANINGQLVNITSARDLIRLGVGNINDVVDSVSETLQLNPLIEQYNYLDYLITQEFMDSTVGSFIAHPEKSKSNDVIQQEAAHFQAQHKRNVSFTAAMHAFQLNLLNGIPEQYNLAVIDDIKDEQGTIIGLNNGIKPFDGATFVNPFVVILENNSLGGARAGITKKQFVHFKNEATGTGGIIKTAGFGLTNDWIRNSPFLERMMRKMTNHIWLNQDGTPAIVDITMSYQGNKISYKDFFFKSGNRYYQILKINSLGNNIYQRTIQEVTIDGNPIGEQVVEEPTVVNTNYKLWNYFGGKNSMYKKNRFLSFSNTSVENVVSAMNNIGTPTGTGPISTQDDLWQPLKQVDVHYLATAGAVKQGAANINSADRYSDDIDYDIQRIKMYQAGIQLDKEHHADNSELSLMTQVISACAAKGYTIDTAIGLYDALRKSTDINTKEHLDAVKAFFTDGSQESIENFQEVMMQSIIKAIGSGSKISNNFAEIIASDLIKQAREGKTIKFSDVLFPLSDNTVYAKILSTVSSYLTNTGIKQSIPGILSVLTPSHNIFQLYGGRKYESFTDPNRELAEMQQQMVPVYDLENPNSNISNLELGRSYYITRNIDQEFYNEDTGETYTAPTPLTEIQLVRTPTEYRKLKQEIASGKVTRVVEAVYDINNNKPIGRDLAGYNVRFNTDGGSFQIWDLDSASALFDLNDLEEKWNGSQENVDELKSIYQAIYGVTPNITIENGQAILGVVKIRMRRMLQNDLMNLSRTTPNVIDQFRTLVQQRQDSREWYNKFAQWVNVKLGRADGSAIRLGDQLVTVNSENFSDVGQQVLRLLQLTQKIRINGEYHTIDKDSIKEQAYEIIMPKTFATAFGLGEFDDLNTIKNDRDFFIKQYLKNQATKVQPNQYSIEFKSSKGDHIYVLNSKFVAGSNLHQVPNILTVDEDGKTYRVDSNGNVLYQLAKESKIYTDGQGNEVIVSDDIDFYINNLFYDSIKLSSNLINYPSVVSSITKSLKKSNNKVARQFNQYITAKGTQTQQIIEANNEFHSLTLENYTQASPTNPIIREGRSKHTSFLRSLDIVAARIPAQSMQSYMPMKVVAFDNPDINTAYVSTYQILLQGSDYDVDAVSLATFDIDSNGILQLWSPYSNIETEDMRKASESLPIPTGLEATIERTEDIQKILDLFQKYSNLFTIRSKNDFNKSTNEWDINPNEVSISWNLSTPENLIELGNMIREVQSILIPTDAYMQQFMQGFIRVQQFIPKTEQQLLDVFEKLKQAIDNHNLYLDNVPKYKLSKIINNYTIQSMYDTILDPVNLIQAQTSVDGTTGPLKEETKKSAEGKEARNRTPGNFVNKYQSITENQVGKEAIAICATGLKGFFGLTQYNNYILNYGTSDQQSRLLLGPEHRGYMIGGKLYKTLANIRSKDPNSITNADVLEALSNVSNDNDAALTLSALLSLATDNAKELALSKLNASTKTIGMYIYGITIGMDFKDVAKLLMSDTGGIITSLLEGDVFAQRDGYTKASSVFEYFEKCPSKQLNRFDIYSSPDGVEIGRSPLDFFEEAFLNQEDWLKDKNGDKLPFNVALASFAGSNMILSDKLNAIEKLRYSYKSASAYAVETYNQLIDFAEDYVRQCHIAASNKSVMDDLQILAEGADEMRRLGSIFSLNQGVKTDTEGLLRQVNLIERAVYDKTGDLEDLIDITKFAFDEDYRQQAIEKYEQVKHSFNILDAVSTVPHFLGYVQMLATALTEDQQSFKFRSAKTLSLELSNMIGFRDETRIIKGVQNYVGDFLRKQWMQQNEVRFVIPRGNKAFDKNGNQYVLTQDTVIQLGTDWGDATFRMFVENQVIPDLKAGIIKPGVEFSGISTNKFLRDLGNDLLTNTVSKNPTIVYALPINMLPRIDQERALLNSYKAEFNKLAQYGYQYRVFSYDDNGNEVSGLSRPISITDIFTYYAMIANGWKLSEKSLVPILEDFQNTGIIKDFHEFESSYDKSGESISLSNTRIEDLIPYIAPYESPYSSYTKDIWYKNPITRKVQLMKRLSSSELQEESELMDEYGHNPNVIGKYKFQEGEVDTNYFPSGQVESSLRTVEHSYDDGGTPVHFQVQYDIDSGMITNVLVGPTHLSLDEVVQIPTIKENGIRKVNVNLLESIIKSKLNPC